MTLSGVGSTTTNGSGVYTFNNVTAGNYTVSVSAAGFSPASSGVTINNGATTTKDFNLSVTDTEPPSDPTNLHVNESLFPNDTVQSRLPDPAWLERWLDEQIRFDALWEKRVVGMILHNLGSLFGQTFATVAELNRFRKALAAAPA